jgi:uroporphyrin-III C-methyltransferase
MTTRPPSPEQSLDQNPEPAGPPTSWDVRTPTAPQRSRGVVYLVGAGPGDPDLITVKGLHCLARADVVVYDRLVHPALLDGAPAEAERIYVGKRCGHHAVTQERIHELLVTHARAGRTVVRLKGGDPFVFGRGGEEAAACAAAGIRWEVVPGVTSAVSAAASAGIPVTHRGVAASFAVVTAHRARGEEAPDWRALAGVDTLVVLMGVKRLAEVTAELLAAGRSPATPAAVIERATLPGSRVVRGTLEDLAARAAEAGIRSPATIVVGEVAALGEELLAAHARAPERLAELAA